MFRLATVLLILLVAPISVAEDLQFDLATLRPFQPKGRVQDHRDPVIEKILATGKASIPRLIDLLESERDLPDSIVSTNPSWPAIVEGDAALVILCDLFLDPSWSRSTLPELCWENLLERQNDSVSGYALLYEHIERFGRASIASRWREVWQRYQDQIEWDEGERFFVVKGKALGACRS